MKISGNRRQARTNKDTLYYGVSDFSVGGRCRCNGHASQCIKNSQGRLVCDCMHHTSGVNCEKCSEFYQDRPWMRATGQAANECIGVYGNDISHSGKNSLKTGTVHQLRTRCSPRKPALNVIYTGSLN